MIWLTVAQASNLIEALKSMLKQKEQKENRDEYISGWLQEQGFEVSKSAVGRYAVRSNSATQRLLEAQAQAEALANAMKQNPEVDYTEAGISVSFIAARAGQI